MTEAAALLVIFTAIALAVGAGVLWTLRRLMTAAVLVLAALDERWFRG